MKSDLPLVSIIITSYNRAGLISKAVESALSQDYPNLEIIISDNCSTDGSDDVIRKYINDPRVKYNRNKENIGMLPNFRKATYELSKGEYLTYISSDDYLISNSFVSDAIAITQRNKNIGLVYGRMCYMNTVNGVLWEMPETPYFLKETWDGKEVFFESMRTVLFSWGACLLSRAEMIKVGALEKELYNSDLDANYKIMLETNIGFVNKLCYWQLGHDDNSGYPANAKLIIQSLDCFENVAAYALTKMPDKNEEVEKWKEHFVLSAISRAFHSLKERNTEQYRVFKKEVRNKYPGLYKRFINSWKYKKLIILHPIKRILPKSVSKAIRSIQDFFKKSKAK
jgi:glycosyltransferase involved in cell wall biosynthesis